MDLESELKNSLADGILSGSIIAKLKRKQIAEEVKSLPNAPFLATVLVGDDPASQVYVSFKEKACNQIGIGNTIYRISNDISEMDLIKKIEELNQDSSVNGILLQLPLPSHINSMNVINKISPIKDVDGLHYDNVGKLHLGLDGFVPCTPAGVMVLLEYAKIEIEGKRVTIIGRSNLVGKPLARLMERANATVTLCHSRTKNIEQITNASDIIVSAIGKNGFVTENMVPKNCIVVDVGTNKVNGKLVGDVDFENVSKRTKLITPVPGGVGPMTITMLLYNTVKAYKRQNNIN